MICAFWKLLITRERVIFKIIFFAVYISVYTSFSLTFCQRKIKLKQIISFFYYFNMVILCQSTSALFSKYTVNIFSRLKTVKQYMLYINCKIVWCYLCLALLWLRSYGSGIYNYLWNQYLSPLTLWILITLSNNIMW